MKCAFTLTDAIVNGFPWMKCKTGRYHWRLDPELGRFRFYDPGEPLPGEIEHGKSAAVHLFKAGYDHGLGRYVGGRGDVKNAIREINEKTGSNIVEVGNERSEGKFKPRQYDKQAMSERMQHLRNQR